jgi:hypothetical protein
MKLPFARLTSQSVLKAATSSSVQELSRNTSEWPTLRRHQLSFFYLIQDLGCGLHGRVWLACSSHGLFAVVKFATKIGNLHQELEIWKKEQY